MVGGRWKDDGGICILKKTLHNALIGTCNVMTTSIKINANCYLNNVYFAGNAFHVRSHEKQNLTVVVVLYEFY